MLESVLILYTRKGCCLCEGLEQRLISLPLHSLNPSLALRLIDIDSSEVTEIERVRFDLKVPIMMIQFSESNQKVELPRVSPRLGGEDLLQWLQKAIRQAPLID